MVAASKFCEKYYGQDGPGASHLAMTNLSKLCTALSTLNNSMPTVSWLVLSQVITSVLSVRCTQWVESLPQSCLSDVHSESSHYLSLVCQMYTVSRVITSVLSVRCTQWVESLPQSCPSDVHTESSHYLSLVRQMYTVSRVITSVLSVRCTQWVESLPQSCLSDVHSESSHYLSLVCQM